MPEPFDETDAVLAGKLAEIDPPEGLLARLLALEPPAEARGPAWWTTGLSAAAAVVLALLALVSLAAPGGDTLDAATAHFAGFLSGSFPLLVKSADLPSIETWIASADRTMHVPKCMNGQKPIGCRSIRWRGHRGALVCFTLKKGGEAHLVMFDAREMPAPAAPRLAESGGWDSASWSADGTTYILFTPRGRMGEVLYAAAVQRGGNIVSSIRNSRAFAAAKDVSGREKISSRV